MATVALLKDTRTDDSMPLIYFPRNPGRAMAFQHRRRSSHKFARLTLGLLLAGVTSDLTAQSPDNPGARTKESWQADADLVKRLSEQPNQRFNYVETDVPQYTLPPIVADESREKSNWDTRRSELLELFRSHVYGRRPSIDAEISFRVEGEIPDPTNGQGVGSKVICTIKEGGRQFQFPFLVYVPRNAQGKVPLIVLIDNRRFPDPAEPTEFWPVATILSAGYATACFHTSDVDPDRADGYAEGVRGFLAKGQPRDAEGWGSLSAWGWAASRILDYALQELPIDDQRTAVVGHSRGGKTALWAAAEDPRFTIAYANESGCGGAALSRRRYGETIGRITNVFPHWFCERLTDYSDAEDKLPVDQHQLMALIAPRAIYVASAAEDLWADPRGEYLSLVEAAPAYTLLGQTSIQQRAMPALDEPRVVGKTGYHIRPGQHDLLLHDWQFFLEFVRQQFSRD